MITHAQAAVQKMENFCRRHSMSGKCALHIPRDNSAPRGTEQQRRTSEQKTLENGCLNIAIARSVPPRYKSRHFLYYFIDIREAVHKW